MDWLALCIMYELSNMLVGLVLDRLRMNSTNCVETEPAFSGIYMYNLPKMCSPKLSIIFTISEIVTWIK